MPRLDPSTMRTFARLLITDDRASKNDAEILTRALKEGETDRVGLDAARDEIETSDLPMDKKKVALRRLEAFLDDSAQGMEAEFYSAPPALMRSLKWNDIHSSKDLLKKGDTPAKRHAISRETGYDEKDIRSLVKQADLRRVDGIDGKIAKVLLDAGVDSVPELATRNPERLLDKLNEYAKSREGYIVGFKVPTSGSGSLADKQLNAVKAMVDQAKGLDRVVTFGDPTSGLEGLSNLQRAEMMNREELDYNEWTGTPVEFLRHAGIDNPEATYESMLDDALWALSSELSNWDIDVPKETLKQLGSYDALLDHVSDDEADALGNGWAAFEPEINVFKDDSGDEVGATIRWSRNLDGDHSYGETSVWDKHAGGFTGSIEWGYETDTVYNID